MKELIKILKTSILLILLLGLNSKLTAQNISFNAAAPKVIRAGEQFQLVFTLNGKVDEFTPPDFGKFRYLGGPSTGSSTSVNFVNGRSSRVSTYTFTYYLQAPAEGGKITLGPATAIHKKNTIQSNSLEIEVLAQNQSASQPSKTSNSQQNTSSTQASNGEDIYVRLEFDKRTAYVGEQITAWVKLYTQVSLSGIDQQFKGPEFVGFYRQNVDIPPLSNLEREKVGDDIYHTGVIQKVILYPQKSGEIKLEPFDLLVEVQGQARRRSQSIFDDFFGSQYERKRINLKSNSSKLNIKPLPGNQPAEYSGAVGKFKIDASANLNEVVTNDAITFKVIVSGKGNVKLIDEVKTNFPPAFEVFDAIKKVQIDAGSQGRTGKAIFEYTAIPRHAGDFEVSPFTLVYFDPAQGSYQTLSSQSFRIRVNKGDGDSTTMASSNLSKEDIELLGSDIRYIEAESNIQNRDNYIFGTTWFFGIYIGFIALFIAILIVRKEQLKRSADIAKYRNRKAGKIASKRLKKASNLLKANDIKAFYEELERALWGYLANKLNIPLFELSVEKAGIELEARNLTEDLRKDFLDIVETCQFARYAPGGMEAQMSGLFEKSIEIINKLDHKL